VLQQSSSTPPGTVDLVVGRDYPGVVTVGVGDPATARTVAAPKPTPSASTSATPGINAADSRCG
jgi:hypothetical protein